MAAYAFILPFAVDDTDAAYLLVRRPFLQKRQGGKAMRGLVPDWAGQWGLIGGALETGEGADAGTIRLFREQAGLDLNDKDVQANFLLGNSATVALETENSTPFSVRCIFTTMAALHLLGSVLSDVIGTEQVAADLIAEAAVLPLVDACGRLGAAPAPKVGWKKYLVTNYYGGKAPGQLNTEIDTLAGALDRSARQDNGFFAAALVSNPG